MLVHNVLEFPLGHSGIPHYSMQACLRPTQRRYDIVEITDFLADAGENLEN